MPGPNSPNNNDQAAIDTGAQRACRRRSSQGQPRACAGHHGGPRSSRPGLFARANSSALLFVSSRLACGPRQAGPHGHLTPPPPHRPFSPSQRGFPPRPPLYNVTMSGCCLLFKRKTTEQPAAMCARPNLGHSQGQHRHQTRSAGKRSYTGARAFPFFKKSNLNQETRGGAGQRRRSAAAKPHGGPRAPARTTRPHTSPRAL